MKLIPRAIEPQVRQRLDSQPAVVLLGPRQVGKTTLARRIADEHNGAAIYLDLERPADLRRLDDADAYLRAQQGKLVVSAPRTGPRSISCSNGPAGPASPSR